MFLHQSRSFREYEACVNRINDYRTYFNSCTLNADFNIALIAFLSDSAKECVGFLLIFWMIFQNDRLTTMLPDVSHSTTALVILYVISMRNIVKSFSQVLDHKSYLRKELMDFQPLTGLLQSTFTSGDISECGEKL